MPGAVSPVSSKPHACSCTCKISANPPTSSRTCCSRGLSLVTALPPGSGIRLLQGGTTGCAVQVLEGLGLTQDQFIDLCILCGCDYCGTIKGAGRSVLRRPGTSVDRCSGKGAPGMPSPLATVGTLGMHSSNGGGVMSCAAAWTVQHCILCSVHSYILVACRHWGKEGHLPAQTAQQTGGCA